MPRNQRWLWLAAAVSLATLVVARAEDAEWRAVIKDRLNLFQGTERKAMLVRDQLVPTTPHPTNHDWLVVTLKDQRFDAERSGFRTLAEIVAAYARDLAQNEARTKSIGDALGRNRDGELAYYAAQLDLEIDRMSYLRETIFKPAPAPGTPGERRPAPPTPPGTDPALQNLVPEYRYTPILARSRAATAERDWSKKLDAIVKDNDKLFAERRQLRQDAQVNCFQTQQTQERFRLAVAGQLAPADQLAPYLVTADGTRLFDQEKPIYTFRKNDVVLARPHPTYPDWLRVRYEHGEASGNLRYFQSRTQLTLDYLRRQAANQEAADRINYELAGINAREKLLNQHNLDLEREAVLDGSYMLRRFTLTTTDARTGTTEVVQVNAPVTVIDRGKERQVLRDWKHELDGLATRRGELEKQLSTIKQDLVTDEQRNTELMRRFATLDAAPPAPLPVLPVAPAEGR